MIEKIRLGRINEISEPGGVFFSHGRLANTVQSSWAENASPNSMFLETIVVLLNVLLVAMIVPAPP